MPAKLPSLVDPPKPPPMQMRTPLNLNENKSSTKIVAKKTPGQTTSEDIANESKGSEQVAATSPQQSSISATTCEVSETPIKLPSLVIAPNPLRTENEVLGSETKTISFNINIDRDMLSSLLQGKSLSFTINLTTVQ